MKVKGLKKAVGEYQRQNSGGIYSPYYGNMMFNKATGELWVDCFYDYGRGDYNVYENPDIVSLSNLMTDYYARELQELDFEINMKTVKEFILKRFKGFEF